MPSGACVIRYDGARGVVWRMKYRDATGRQVKETLGRAADGWNEQRAERELGKRLDEVEKGMRKATRETFGDFAERFLTTYVPTRNLKRSTLLDYENTIRQHAIPFLGDRVLADVGPEDLDGYVAAKMETLAPKTIANHLATLRLVFKVAVRWKAIRENPALEVDGPRVDSPETVVLTEAEVARLLTAFHELAGDADETERPWWQLVERMVRVALGTAVRRGELLALRWVDVSMLERRLRVERAYVRGEITTPKSRASRRTVHFGDRTRAVFEAQWEASRWRRDEDLVFPHPALGTPLDPSKLTRTYLVPALERAKIDKPPTAVARPPPHGADDGRRGRQPKRLRASEGRAFAVLDHRAVRPRGAGRVPRCRGSW